MAAKSGPPIIKQPTSSPGVTGFGTGSAPPTGSGGTSVRRLANPAYLARAARRSSMDMSPGRNGAPLTPLAKQYAARAQRQAPRTI